MRFNDGYMVGIVLDRAHRHRHFFFSVAGV